MPDAFKNSGTASSESFAVETAHEKKLKAERRKRERIITDGLKVGKYAVEIHKDIRAAGLTGCLSDVQKWTRHYRWKLEQRV